MNFNMLKKNTHDFLEEKAIFFFLLLKEKEALEGTIQSQ